MFAAAVGLAACGSTTSGGGGSSSPTTSKTTVKTKPGHDSTSTTTTTTSPMEAPLPQPTAAQPLTIVEIGDSLGMDLGFGLGDDVFATDPYVKIEQDAVGDTGLARPDYYNWPARLEALLQEYHPGAVVIFLGGNDAQGFDVNGEAVAYGTPLWFSVYRSRVADMMSEAVAAKVRVLWVGMPIMESAGFSSEMQQLNAIYAQEATKHPGVTYFSSWPVLATPQGQYTSSLVVHGQTVLLRDPDGVHLATGGFDLLAQALVAPMEKAWGIKLFPPAG